MISDRPTDVRYFGSGATRNMDERLRRLRRRYEATGDESLLPLIHAHEARSGHITAEYLRRIEQEFDKASGMWRGVDWTHLIETVVFIPDEDPDTEGRWVDLSVDASQIEGDVVPVDLANMMVTMSQWGYSDYWIRTGNIRHRNIVRVRLRDALAELIAEASEYVRGVEAGAAQAQEHARMAVERARAGDWQEALSLAAAAASVESQYGDDPTWGPLFEMVEEAAGIHEEMLGGRGNPDAETRRLQRESEADPADTGRHLAWLRARQRAGGRDGFAAAQEEVMLIRGSGGLMDALEDRWREEREKIRREEDGLLRAIHQRIRRSKRREIGPLREWSLKVAHEAAKSVIDRMGAVYDEAYGKVKKEYTNLRERVNDLDVIMRQVSWSAYVEASDRETEYRFHSTSTFSGVGYGADGYARLGAEDDVRFLGTQGVSARAEQEPGDPWPPTGPPRTPGISGVGAYAWIRPGQGWRSLAKVASQLDVDILRARQDDWKARDREGYLEEVAGIPRRGSR